MLILNEKCTTLSHKFCIMKFGKKPFYKGKRKVIEIVQYNYIRFLYFSEHKSQRGISKEMGIYKESYLYLKS